MKPTKLEPPLSIAAVGSPTPARARTDALKERAYGRGVRALRRLLELKRTYPSGPFLAAVEEAFRFGLFDLQRLEGLILKQVAGDFFNLGGERDEDA